MLFYRLRVPASVTSASAIWPGRDSPVNLTCDLNLKLPQRRRTLQLSAKVAGQLDLEVGKAPGALPPPRPGPPV